MFVLNDWVFDFKPDTLWGVGNQYDQNRNLIAGWEYSASSNIRRPKVEISNANIVLIESNKMLNATGNLSAIAIVGVPFGILTGYCLVNPKACFGSCPTFYAFNGRDMELMAEGFSSSILPVFEKRDVDMLYWSQQNGREFQVKLTNEAMETHVIRYADLLVFPVDKGERVFASEKGRFFKTEAISDPRSCIAEEGNVRDQIREMDHIERFSGADSDNLAQRESIELEFEIDPEKNHGLLIGSRQTLLTTWLFYQSLAYAGTMAGHYAAAVERGDKGLKKKVRKVWDMLGGIEIFVQNHRGKWILVNELREMGPIAADVHLVELPEVNTAKMNIKLKLTKGLWRIDYLALATLDEEVFPERIRPAEVLRDNEKDDLTKQLLYDTISPLITFPGDQYLLTYTLPEGENFEVFLDSKGYYLEWMREEWLAEEDMQKAALMFTLPGLYLRMSAKAFKEVEPFMEEKFWGSRYVRH